MHYRTPDSCAAFCLHSFSLFLVQPERVLAYDVMYTFAQVMANGAPQFANGNQFVGWDEKSEQATVVGPLPATITQAAMPFVTKCKLFDLPKSKPDPPVPGFPVASPDTPAPPAPTINCFVKPGKARDLPQAAKESDSQVVADAPPKSVLCYGPGNYQVSSPGAKSATRKQRGAALAVVLLHATLAGVIALVTLAV